MKKRAPISNALMSVLLMPIWLLVMVFVVGAMMREPAYPVLTVPAALLLMYLPPAYGVYLGIRARKASEHKALSYIGIILNLLVLLWLVTTMLLPQTLGSVL